MLRVTQISVFEEFNLFLLIADKSLIAYHLDTVCLEKGSVPQGDSQRRAPQKLSGNREVGFFAAGRMKDRALVFYKKRDGISSTFKVTIESIWVLLSRITFTKIDSGTGTRPSENIVYTVPFLTKGTNRLLP